MGKMNEDMNLNVHNYVWSTFSSCWTEYGATDAWLKWSIVRGDNIPIDRLVETNQAKHLSSIRKAW